MTQKLLYVLNHMDWFWSHRLSLAQAAQAQGWDVLVCAPGAAQDAALKNYGFRGISLCQISGPYSALRATYEIRKIILRETPDLLHAITIKYAFLAGLATRYTSVKVVHTIAGLGYLFAGDGWRPKLLRFLVTPFFRAAFMSPRTRVIFQNPDDLALMVRRGFADPQQAHLIKGSGVDLEKFTFSPEPASADNRPLVLFPTRLVWEKGISVFIDAARLLEGRSVAARYLIAGGVKTNTPRAIRAQEMTALLQGTPVEWAGHVEDMSALLWQSALIAYPSWYGEGIPKVLLEAAACGRPIVTTDHPGCREAVRSGENGMLVPVKSAEALADALDDLLRHPELRQKMGAASRHLAEEIFDVHKINAQTLAVYERLCKNQKSS